jgi:hypothetical protein
VQGSVPVLAGEEAWAAPRRGEGAAADEGGGARAAVSDVGTLRRAVAHPADAASELAGAPDLAWPRVD